MRRLICFACRVELEVPACQTPRGEPQVIVVKTILEEGVVTDVLDVPLSGVDVSHHSGEVDLSRYNGASRDLNAICLP